jgi:hypothetical protein
MENLSLGVFSERSKRKLRDFDHDEEDLLVITLSVHTVGAASVLKGATCIMIDVPTQAVMTTFIPTIRFPLPILISATTPHSLFVLP